MPADWFSANDEPDDGPGTSYLEALRAALDELLERDDRVLLLGEDIGRMGGAFRVTEGLFERFGPERVLDTPMAETALLGSAIGLAISGWRPVVELQFADFISCCYDQLVNEAAKLHYRFGIPVPIVIRCPAGGSLGAGPFHSQSPEGIFAHIPGLKIVCPGTVQDAHDLLLFAAEDPDPVLFFEQKSLYRSLRAPLGPRDPAEGLGRASVRRAGEDVTIVTYGAMVVRALAAAEALWSEGISAEVIDLRTLRPLDIDTIADSVGRTARLAIVHEDTRTGGFAAEIATLLAESRVFYELDAPVARITAPDTPVPFAAPLEESYVPSIGRITDTVRQLVHA